MLTVLVPWLVPGLATNRQALTLLPVRMISQLWLPPQPLSWAAQTASPLLQERVASLLSLTTSLPLSCLFVLSIQESVSQL